MFLNANTVKASGNRAAQYFLLSFFFILVVFYSIPIPLIESSDEFLVLLLAATSLVAVVRHKKIPSLLRWEKQFLCAFLITCLFGGVSSLVYRYQPLEAVMYDLLIFSKPFAVYYFARITFNNYNPGYFDKKIPYAVMCAVVVVVFLVLINKTVGVYPRIDMRFDLSSEYLFFGHPSRYSSFFAFAFCLLLPYFFENKKHVLIAILLFGLLGLRVKFFAFFLVAIFFMIAYRKILIRKSSSALKFLALFVAGGVVLVAAFDQIKYYYSLGGFYNDFARSVMGYYSFIIASDNFPLGAGFASFGSWFSGVFYSPVYQQYGIDHVYGMTANNYNYIADSYWAMVLGQFGFVGLCMMLFVFFVIFKGIYSMSFSLMAFNDKASRFTRLIVFSMLLLLISLLIDSTSDSILTQSRGVWAFLFIALAVGKVVNYRKTLSR